MSKAQTVTIDALRPNKFNSNVVSPENQEKLDESVRRFGVFKPIVVREVGTGDEMFLEIIGGEHRWDSAKRMGLDEIPIFNLGLLDDKRAKEIMLADNARYGQDDAIELAAILEAIGQTDAPTFLPYSDEDVQAIFSSLDIELDELEIDEKFENPAIPETPTAKAPKTHTFMRFKVPLGDSEKITTLIAQTQKRFGYSSEDELTNAGDALVHLLLGATAP